MKTKGSYEDKDDHLFHCAIELHFGCAIELHFGLSLPVVGPHFNNIIEHKSGTGL